MYTSEFSSVLLPHNADHIPRTAKYTRIEAKRTTAGRYERLDPHTTQPTHYTAKPHTHNTHSHRTPRSLAANPATQSTLQHTISAQHITLNDYTRTSTPTYSSHHRVHTQTHGTRRKHSGKTNGDTHAATTSHTRHPATKLARAPRYNYRRGHPLVRPKQC